MRLLLDMDGVIADFDAACRAGVLASVWCRQHTDEILARPRATTTKETP